MGLVMKLRYRVVAEGLAYPTDPKILDRVAKGEIVPYEDLKLTRVVKGDIVEAITDGARHLWPPDWLLDQGHLEVIK
jgi:hypothetical protein